MKREHESGRRYLTASVLVMLGLGLGFGNRAQTVYAAENLPAESSEFSAAEPEDSGGHAEEPGIIAGVSSDENPGNEAGEMTGEADTGMTDPEDADKEDADPENTNPESADPENPELENTDSEDVEPENAGSEDTDSENAEVGKADPENPEPETADPENPDPGTKDSETEDPENGDPEDEEKDEEEIPVYLSIMGDIDYAPVYDFFYYKNRYSDLAAAFGNDQTAMLQHFLKYGMKEQRRANEDFDEISYRFAYQDLRRAYGTDYVKYYEHYLKWGINEGRVTTGVTTLQNPVTVQDGTDYSLVYDYDYYTKNNPDVARYYGQDDIGVLSHFVKYGMKEQRQAISTFNEKSYRYTYTDLRLAYGSDYEKYYLHYIKYGNKENRKTTGTTTFKPITVLDGTDYSLVYDFNYYISRYPDMKKYFGDDDAGAIKHFVKYGMKEERQAISSFDERSYRYRYQDLRYAYRTDFAKYYTHYIKYGQKEKRNATGGLTDFVSPVTKLNGTDYSPVYDFKYYVTNQKSAAAYKNDDVGALIYFVNTGMSQRHQASENFEVMSYRRAYTDLRADYGDDFPAYYLHYIEKGQKEGRTKTTGWVSNGLVVCLDPGHQRRANTAKEPIGPGSSTMKMKVTGGASGTVTRNAEYEIVLNIAFMLRDELEDRGYTVVLTRTSHDVNLTNIERAKIAAEADADIFIRLHCDSNTSSSLNGVHCLGPAANNPYLSSEVIRKSNILCDCLQAGQVAQTGQNTRKNSRVNNMTGINWAEMPVSIIEMGFLSNPSEDRFLGKTSNQKLISKGLANGVDNYFAKVS